MSANPPVQQCGNLFIDDAGICEMLAKSQISNSDLLAALWHPARIFVGAKHQAPTEIFRARTF